jgi:hypothetical protein
MFSFILKMPSTSRQLKARNILFAMSGWTKNNATINVDMNLPLVSARVFLYILPTTAQNVRQTTNIIQGKRPNIISF